MEKNLQRIQKALPLYRFSIGGHPQKSGKNANCCYSSGVEHFLGKEEVVSSNLTNSSKRVYHGRLFLIRWRYRLGVRT